MLHALWLVICLVLNLHMTASPDSLRLASQPPPPSPQSAPPPPSQDARGGWDPNG